jgi:hypothetical protein
MTRSGSTGNAEVSQTRTLDLVRRGFSFGDMTGNIDRLLQTSEPPELGPGRREGTLSVAEIARAPEPAPQPLVRAMLLLWHDHLDEAHAIAQDIETADGSYVHAIMHRREPDYGNAKYWFRRAGQHPEFTALATRARELLRDDKVLADRLAPRGQWDPFAFVDACEQAAAGRLTRDQAKALRSIQATEMTSLLHRFAE